MSLQRNSSEVITLTITDSIATCEELPFGSFAGGSIIVPSGSSLTSLTPYGCNEPGGTYVPIYDSSNTAVSRTVAASRGYAIPDECFGFRFIKFLGNTTGTIKVNLKS
jgi:hypothetical protein